MAGAFAAMVFVGASWGANVPVTKVMLLHFDLIPMAAIRTVAAAASLGLLLWMVEGMRALRVELRLPRFLMLGFIQASFFAVYALGLNWSNPITAAAIGVVGPLVSAVTVRLAAGLRFDPGFGTALALTLVGGVILASSSLFGKGDVTFGGGEPILLFSNALWTLYSLKAQAWFDRASQLHRAYVASLSAMGWLIACSLVLVALGRARSPFEVHDGWLLTDVEFGLCNSVVFPLWSDDARVEEVLAGGRARGVPQLWWLGKDQGRGGLLDRLDARGVIRHFESLPGMVH